MSAPQFSPRPWHYGPAVVTGTMGVIAADDTFVCGQIVNNPAYEDIGKANARLIAAAPELYEALTVAVHHLRCSAANPDHYYSMATLSMLDEALAKARGEQA